MAFVGPLGPSVAERCHLTMCQPAYMIMVIIRPEMSPSFPNSVNWFQMFLNFPKNLKGSQNSKTVQNESILNEHRGTVKKIHLN